MLLGRSGGGLRDGHRRLHRGGVVLLLLMLLMLRVGCMLDVGWVLLGMLRVLLVLGMLWVLWMMLLLLLRVLRVRLMLCSWVWLLSVSGEVGTTRHVGLLVGVRGAISDRNVSLESTSVLRVA